MITKAETLFFFSFRPWLNRPWFVAYFIFHASAELAETFSVTVAEKAAVIFPFFMHDVSELMFPLNNFRSGWGFTLTSCPLRTRIIRFPPRRVLSRC